MRQRNSAPQRALLRWRCTARASARVGGVRPRCSRRPSSPVPSSAFAGFRFPPEVILLAVRWYLRFGLSYRDVEELLAERGIEVDHVGRRRAAVPPRRWGPLA